MADLYETYRHLGLEIVALSFEEEDQLANPARLRAFIKRYDLDYTFLLAGVPDDATVKLPQAVNLNAFPTTCPRRARWTCEGGTRRLSESGQRTVLCGGRR